MSARADTAGGTRFEQVSDRREQLRRDEWPMRARVLDAGPLSDAHVENQHGEVEYANIASDGGKVVGTSLPEVASP